MTFKCHKTEAGGASKTVTMYPVNFIGFNSRYDKYLYTGGSDGTLYYWDFNEKNKITSFNFNNRCACAAAISPSGEFMAYSTGYDWHEGVSGLSKNITNNIFVHPIT